MYMHVCINLLCVMYVDRHACVRLGGFAGSIAQTLNPKINR